MLRFLAPHRVRLRERPCCRRRSLECEPGFRVSRRVSRSIYAEHGNFGQLQPLHQTEIRSRSRKRYLYFLFICPYEKLYGQIAHFPAETAIHSGREQASGPYMGTDEIKSPNIPKAIEDLVRFPVGDLLYIRLTWREVQPRPGRLVLPDYLKLVFELAKTNNKRIGLRVQMSAPDYTHSPALPDFVLDRVPKVDLVLSGTENQAAAQRYLNNPHGRYQPRFDDPFFQQAFRNLVIAMAEEFNGNPSIEFIDTFMYGFWGEGHTWPFSNNPFPDYPTAERTWVNMLEVQLEHFTKTPLLTNTQPDFSRVATPRFSIARCATITGFAAIRSSSRMSRLKRSAIVLPGPRRCWSKRCPASHPKGTNRTAYLRPRT